MIRRLVLVLAACAGLAAADPLPLPAGAAALPVLHQGRIKPLAIAAEEEVLLVAGKTPFGLVEGTPRRIVRRIGSAALLVDWWREAGAWRQRPLVQVPWLALQADLGIPGQWAAPAELEPAGTRIEAVLAERRQAEASGIRRRPGRDEEALVELARRIAAAEDALGGRDLLLAPLAPDAAARAWVLAALPPLLEREAHGVRPWRGQVREALRRSAADERDAALARNDPWLSVEDLCLRPDPVLAGLCATGQAPDDLAELLGAGAQWWRALQGDGDYPAAHARLESALRQRAARREGELRARGVGSEQVASYPGPGLIRLELAYHAARPFTWAWIAFLAGALAVWWGAAGAAPAWRRRLGAGLIAAGLALTIAGLGARIAITGLGAVSTLYETLIYVALVTGLLGLVLWRTARRPALAVAGGLAAALCAMVGEAIPPEYGASIGQLQPVLRSRFWLWLHVKVVVAAYAPFVLAWVLGNAALWRAWRAGRQVGAEEARAIHRCLQVGTVLMAAGTLLGGVWADQAWGRFWGWDPKEVGALIVVLTYLVPLHLRYAGWVGGSGLAAWATLGFLAVVWSWYGVNFIQATGLHAYAFGSSHRLDQLLVGGAALLQVLYTVGLLLRLRSAPR